MRVSFAFKISSMKRVFLPVLAIVLLALSCGRDVKPPATYTVTNDASDSLVSDIYIPDNGTYDMKVLVKFLNGWKAEDDKVTLILTGIPPHVTVTPDTFTATPTFTADMVFKSDTAVQGVYPVTLTSSTYYGLPQVYNFNVHIIPADCAAYFWGSLSGSSLCTSRSYTHTATGTSGGTNVLMINNFGGYGAPCDVKVDLDCNHDSVHIANAYYGNGVTLQGRGIFDAHSMVIEYTASTLPTGGSESCTITYSR